MNITLNGTATEVPDGTTIGALVDRVVHDRTRVAVERNEEIVPRAAYDATPVADGDTVTVDILFSDALGDLDMELYMSQADCLVDVNVAGNAMGGPGTFFAPIEMAN